MSNSVFLARLIGPVMLVVGLSVFVHQREFREMSAEFLASRALLFLSGFILMPAGLAVVLMHNVWTADWRALVTILGWLMTIGGILRLLAPKFLLQAGQAFLREPRSTQIAGAVWIVLGLLYSALGYLQ
jgi:hypothetical protein